MAELHELKQLLPDSPIFFVLTSTMNRPGSTGSPGPTSDALELTESEQHELELLRGNGPSQSQEVKARKEVRPWRKDSRIYALAQQLESLGSFWCFILVFQFWWSCGL